MIILIGPGNRKMTGIVKNVDLRKGKLVLDPGTLLVIDHEHREKNPVRNHEDDRKGNLAIGRGRMGRGPASDTLIVRKGRVPGNMRTIIGEDIESPEVELRKTMTTMTEGHGKGMLPTSMTKGPP